MNRLRHLSRRWLFVPGVLLLVAIALYDRETAAPTGRGGTPPPAIPDLTTNERAYYEYAGPRLHDLVGETEVLADMGRKQSRNVLVLEKTYGRTTPLIDQIQKYEQVHGVPPRFKGAHDDMTSGIATIKQTMEERKQPSSDSNGTNFNCSSPRSSKEPSTLSTLPPTSIRQAAAISAPAPRRPHRGNSIRRFPSL